VVFVRDSVSYPIGLFSKLRVASEFAYPDSITLESGVNFYSSYRQFPPCFPELSHSFSFRIPFLTAHPVCFLITSPDFFPDSYIVAS